MKRREFLTTSLAAATAAPLAAHPMLAAAPKAAPKVPAMLYLYSKHQAERFGPASVASLTRTLGISPQSAKAISAKLLQNGVIAAPGVKHAQHFAKRPSLKLKEAAQNLATKAQKLDELAQSDPDEAAALSPLP